MKISKEANPVLSYKDFVDEVINDYKIAVTSRECSILGRREVLTEKLNLEFLEMEKKFLNLQWLSLLKMVTLDLDIIEIRLL